MKLSDRQWAIIQAALLETPHDVIQDCLGGTEFSPISDTEIDELLEEAKQQTAWLMSN